MSPTRKMLMIVMMLVIAMAVAAAMIVWRFRTRRRRRTTAASYTGREETEEIWVSSAGLPQDRKVDRGEAEERPAVSCSSPSSAAVAGDEGEDRAVSSSRSPSGPSASEDGAGGGFKFEVFISFRWQDTANGFCWQLHEALKQRDVRAFLMNGYEEMLNTGDMASEAMNRAEVFIPIFSRGYAERRSCLDEMAKMVECKKLMLPVFYDVEPREVRNQKGPFEAAFKRYEEDEGLDKKKVKAWRDALKEVGEIKGYDVKTEAEGQERKLIPLIVKRVLDGVSKISVDVAKYPVGLDSRATDVMKLLDLEDYRSRMVGICGIGGVGKTTLAKAIYNKLSSSFEARCFLFGIKEVSKQISGLVSLQKQLILEVLNDKHTSITSVDEGIGVIKKRFHCKSALIILDDVDDNSQIKALAGARDWFHPKSRILITTRGMHVLNLQKLTEDDIYQLEELNDEQSLQLFSYHAFGRSKPMEKYIKLSEKIVQSTGGLPLTLEVVGSLFFDKNSVEEWEDVLKTLRKNQPKDVHQSLRISYDNLDETEKEMFLDIACFFIGRGKENAIFMWKDCDFFPIIGTKVLLHKSLIKIAGREDEFEMHDQIRDISRQIVLQERSPGLRTRLWNNDDIFDVLQHQTGTRNVKGVVFDLKEGDEMCLSSKDFRTMPELRLLNVSYAKFEGEYPHLPRTLKWLEWREYPLDSLPYDFYLENVVVLDLSYAMITKVWDQQGPPTKAFDKLKVLDLNWCENLTTSLDFSSMQYIVKLVLDMCCELTELDESIGLLKSLRYMSMRDCSRLKNLPNNICQLCSLEILDISRCYKISVLPEQLGYLESLSRLIVDGTRIIALPDSLSLMKKLIVLSVEGCRLLRGLPEWIGGVESLRELKLQESAIEGVPESIGSLTNLLTLDATACRSLGTLPDSVGNAKALRHLRLSGTAIQELPHSIASLEKLGTLSLHGCPNLKVLTSSIGLLKNLEMLSLYRLGIRELPENIGSLTKLRKLVLASNPELTTLPSSFFLLTSLENLSAAECHWMDGIDGNHFSKLSSLKELHLNSSSFRSLPSTLYSLSQLTLLNLYECKRLQFLPKLPGSLLSLALTDCIALESISDISNLSSLTILDLDGCLMLYDVPGLENLKRLEKLSLKHCRRVSDTLRNRLKVPNFDHLFQFSISESLRLGDSADPQLFFILPKMFRSRKVHLDLKGCFNRAKEIAVYIEVTAGKHTVYRSMGQHVLQLNDKYCQITFNEDDELHEHIRTGYVVVHIEREGLQQGNIYATME